MADPSPVGSGKVGYCAYAPTGLSGSFTATQLSKTQEYAGASDLDIKPADNTTLNSVRRVYVDANKPISGALYYDTASWTTNTSIYLELANPSGAIVGTKTYTSTTSQGATLNVTSGAVGYCMWKIRSYNTPSGNAKPAYWLRSTYTGPQQ